MSAEHREGEIGSTDVMGGLVKSRFSAGAGGVCRIMKRESDGSSLRKRVQRLLV